MKQRIEFKGFVDVHAVRSMTVDEASQIVRRALCLGDKHAETFTTTLDDVTFFSTVGDDE